MRKLSNLSLLLKKDTLNEIRERYEKWKENNQEKLELSYRENFAEARKHNLDISRITEQALTSILYYLRQQNKTVSSISLNPCSLQRENGWARSSVRLERLTLNP